MKVRDASGVLHKAPTVQSCWPKGWSHNKGSSRKAHASQEQMLTSCTDMVVEHDFLSQLDPNLVLHVLSYVDPMDLASLEATSSVFQKPANCDPNEGLPFPELAARAMCEGSYMFKQLQEAEKWKLRRQCGGSWKLVLRFLKVRESLRQETPQIVAGPGHTVIITKSGAAYSFGANECGQLGHALQTDLWKPRLISSIDRVRVIQAAVGIQRTMLVTDMGKVYACGRNVFNEEDPEIPPSRPTFTPELVMSLHNIFVVQIAIGFLFTAVLSGEGRVYTFAWGSEYKLAHGTDSKDMEPHLLGGDLAEVPVVQIAAGYCFLLALAYQPNGMSIYSVGCGAGGKLGHGSTKNLKQPMRIEHLQRINFKPIAIAAGVWHAVALSQDGRVCTWGWCSRGSLGHGSDLSQTLPMVVGGLAGVNVIRIAAGYDTTIVYADNGGVFCCGDLPCLKQEGQFFVPHLLTTLRERGEHVVQISKTNNYSSKVHVLVLTASGKLFACGDGSQGQLGIHLPNRVLQSPEVVEMDWSLN